MIAGFKELKSDTNYLVLVDGVEEETIKKICENLSESFESIGLSNVGIVVTNAHSIEELTDEQYKKIKALKK